MGMMDKAKDMISGNKDKVEEGVEKAGDWADERTKGKYSDKIDTAQDKARDQLDKM